MDDTGAVPLGVLTVEHVDPHATIRHGDAQVARRLTDVSYGGRVGAAGPATTVRIVASGPWRHDAGLPPSMPCVVGPLLPPTG